MRLICSLLFAVLACGAAHADLARVFADTGVTGTIVIADLDGARVFEHDGQRARTRFTEASTFKIFNSLIYGGYV
jgi:beta-lactamase class D